MLKENLQHLMKIHGNLSITELARLTNIPQPTLHHILSGITKVPRKKALHTLASFFSIPVQQLIGNEPLLPIIPDLIKDELKISTVPKIQWEQLTHWPNKVSEKNRKEILTEKKLSNDSFALAMPNHMINPMFPEKALLIFDADKKPVDRDFIIVRLPHNQEIIFNRYFDDQGDYIKQELEDGNVKLMKLDFNTDYLLGTLIEVRIQY